MAPSRPLKRQKTNPETQPQPQPQPPPPQTAEPQPEHVPLRSDAQTKGTTPTAGQNAPEPKPSPPQPDPPRPLTSSWYPSWSRKTAPTTTTSRQSVSSASLHDETASVVSDTSRSPSTSTITPRRASTRSASLAMTLGKAGSVVGSGGGRGEVAGASTTRVHVERTGSGGEVRGKGKGEGEGRKGSGAKREEGKGKAIGNEDVKKDGQERSAVIPESTQPTAEVGEDKQKQSTPSIRGSRQSGWFGWLAKEEAQQAHEGGETPKAKVPFTDTPDIAVTKPSVATESNGKTQSDAVATAKSDDKPETSPSTSQKRSWLQMLGADSSVKSPAPASSASAPSDVKPAEGKPKALDLPQTPAKTQSQASSIETSPPPPLPGNAGQSAGWVFWSREKKPPTSTSATEGQPHEGEIAISDTPSQHRPKRASISLPEDAKPTPKDLKAKADKAGSIKSVERPSTPAESKAQKPAEPKATKKIESKNAAAVALEQPSPRPASPAPSKRATDNLLLPAFHDTLHLHQSPTLLQQLSRLLYYTKEPELKHLSLTKDPPRLKSALAIGVHGYFPGPMVRTLLGQPTGTSIKFADMAAKSIRRWTAARGYDCQVKTAALEGEGKIAERVELLWKLLLNWIDEIRRSDFVMVACHSQGVPVAVMLVAKLIQFGCVTASRVGICAMAGVSMGPFLEYKSRWISGSAGELFEFSDPNSTVSSMYAEAVDTVLKAGVRWTLVGSIDDQLVSLESSIFAPITHPHIYRAVLIDSRIHAPGFLSHLVGFVLKLRNLGVQDHGLIRELSGPLAGSLYSGEGHSRIYDDEAVYDLAVSFALETTALLGVDVTRRNTLQSSSSMAGSGGNNPYILPFAMRGILEEEVVRSDLREEVDTLLRQFDDWKPTTKALRDVKFRLEGVRSKL